MQAPDPPHQLHPLDPAWAHVTVRADLGQTCLRSREAFAAGAALAHLGRGAGLLATPTRHTVQLGDREHLVLSPACLELINHACEPNVAFDLGARRLVALRPIAPDDEIVYFYPSTEWEMAEPFHCRCGSPRCIGEVRGAGSLPRTTLERYPLSPFIRARLSRPA